MAKKKEVYKVKPLNENKKNVNGKPHTWSKKSAALAGGDC